MPFPSHQTMRRKWAHYFQVLPYTVYTQHCNRGIDCCSYSSSLKKNHNAPSAKGMAKQPQAHEHQAPQSYMELPNPVMDF
jgi:hypothetical protein